MLSFSFGNFITAKHWLKKDSFEKRNLKIFSEDAYPTEIAAEQSVLNM